MKQNNRAAGKGRACYVTSTANCDLLSGGKNQRGGLKGDRNEKKSVKHTQKSFV